MEQNITALSKLRFLKRYLCLSDVAITQYENGPAFHVTYFYDGKKRASCGVRFKFQTWYKKCSLGQRSE
jgi:hypothetical protein